MSEEANPSRPSKFEDRYRLYLDESGDHVFRETTETAHRFLCLLGCWFQNPAYVQFHEVLERFKEKHFHHHPDNPVILHREDIINARRVFKSLQDEEKRAAFDAEWSESLTGNSTTTNWKAMGSCFTPKNKRASCETLLRLPLRAIHLR